MRGNIGMKKVNKFTYYDSVNVCAYEKKLYLNLIDGVN